jgi:DNA-binding phage protein
MAKHHKFRRAYTEAEKRIVWEVLQAIRGRNNSEVARECGLTNGTVSKWRTRMTKCPSMRSVLKVAAAMGLQVGLVEAVEKPEAAQPTLRSGRARNEALPRVH